MKSLDKLIERIATAFLWIAATGIILIALLVIAAASMRYLVGRPFDFTEEVVALLYVLVVFAVLPMITWRGYHITVSLLPERLVDTIRSPIRMAAGLVMIVFSTWFSVEAYQFTAVSQEMGSRSEQVGILLWPWMALIPLSIVVSTLVSVRLLFGPSSVASDNSAAAPMDPT